MNKIEERFGLYSVYKILIIAILFPVLLYLINRNVNLYAVIGVAVAWLIYNFLVEFNFIVINSNKLLVKSFNPFRKSYEVSLEEILKIEILHHGFRVQSYNISITTSVGENSTSTGMSSNEMKKLMKYLKEKGVNVVEISR